MLSFMSSLALQINIRNLVDEKTSDVSIQPGTQRGTYLRSCVSKRARRLATAPRIKRAQSNGLCV